MRRQAIAAFLERSGYGGAAQYPLAGDASFRRYIRIVQEGHSFMLMDAPPGKEDVGPYVKIARYLRARGYSAPAILACDEQEGLLLLEDLGDDSFTRVIAEGGSEATLYEAAVDLLAQWHDGAHCFSDCAALPLPAYDAGLLLHEASLFADWFLPQALGVVRAEALRAEYMGLWETILASAELNTDCVVHRDFHADNLMWLPDRQGCARVGLLDFQDAVYGDAAYDLVSLLEDARRDVSAGLASELLARYLAAAGGGEAGFRRRYAVLGAQRNCKIVGIFTRLCVRDGKRHYLRYLPRVWGHLERDLAHPALVPLREWLDTHIAADRRGPLAA